MNISTKQKQTHWHKEQTYGCKWGGKDWDFGISRCKLLYRRWINNKVQLYSTGKYIQYPVINHDGKKWTNIFICIAELNLFAGEQKLTQWINCTSILKLKRNHKKKKKKNSSWCILNTAKILVSPFGRISKETKLQRRAMEIKEGKVLGKRKAIHKLVNPDSL